MPRLIALSRLLVSAVSFQLACSQSVTIPLAPPSTAASLKPYFFSLSIEQDRWTDWIGTTAPNTFFLNTLDNLRQRTGQPPGIRIGANSEDRTNFNAAVQFTQTEFPPPTATVPYPEATQIVVGDKYYQTARFLPPGTHVTWGVNFGDNNITSAQLEAQSIQRAFSSSDIKNAGIVLDFVEIGNEADLYLNNGHRDPSTWTIQEYVKEWTTFAATVGPAAGLSANSGAPKFLGTSFAGSSHSTSSFSPQGAFSNGLLNSPQGKLITTISQHHYSGSFCSGSEGLLQDLMTKSTIRSNLSDFSPDVAAVRAQGLDYILGETNSYSCHGAPGVSNTAGAALWSLDYALFSSQIGVSQIFFHDGIGFKYNFIQPVSLNRSTLDGSPLTTPLPPHVQPQYYAAIIITEAIGASGNTKAVELNINDPRVSGFAFFEGSTLKRAVLINSDAFTASSGSGTTRPSKKISLNFSGSGQAPKSMTVKRLAIGSADDTSGLTWGGQSFETSDARPSGNIQTTMADTSSSVTLSSTEAIMLSFN